MDGGGKALKSHEVRKKEWKATSSNLSSHLKRDPSELLMNRASWQHRKKIEEREIIDASVPISARGGDTGFEMSLRGGAGGAGGVRYVQIGSSFPYPLYCPVQDRDHKPANSNTFTRMVFQEGVDNQREVKEGKRKEEARNLMATEYFKQMEKLYKGSIRRRFAHRFDGDHVSSLLEVVGRPPPTSDEPIPEDDEAEDGVVTYPPPARPGTAASAVSDRAISELRRGESPDGTQTTHASTRGSAFLSADKIPGPEVRIGCRRVAMDTKPNQRVHHTIPLTNTGSTAIYYTLRMRERTDMISPPPPGRERPLFAVCAPLTGCILPGNGLNVAFSFEHELAGIYDELWELLCTPAAHVVCEDGTQLEPEPVGEIRMDPEGNPYPPATNATPLFLRATCVAPTDSVLHPQMWSALLEDQSKKMVRGELSELLTHPFNQPHTTNPYTLKNMENEALQEERDIAERKRVEEQKLAEQKKRWEADPATGERPFNPNLYGKFEDLHSNVRELQEHLGCHPLPPERWDGSLYSVVEAIQQVEDGPTRSDLMGAYCDLHALVQDPLVRREKQEAAEAAAPPEAAVKEKKGKGKKDQVDLSATPVVAPPTPVDRSGEEVDERPLRQLLVNSLMSRTFHASTEILGNITQAALVAAGILEDPVEPTGKKNAKPSAKKAAKPDPTEVEANANSSGKLEGDQLAATLLGGSGSLSMGIVQFESNLKETLHRMATLVDTPLQISCQKRLEERAEAALAEAEARAAAAEEEEGQLLSPGSPTNSHMTSRPVSQQSSRRL